ncbi:carotenoid biosynthesis protein [Vicingaceae bacterium]|nr:carotenoid biosynthesis protein [Vicingaceae bacterium]MDB4061399.1 carotenoid biosynthesis protein [Vicingaceae bacterium]MDC1451440.1 carotenoid biosynthesis protein [Vicingaceae bacterium]
MIEKPSYLPDQIVIQKEHYAIGILWLFQFSAIVGIVLGFQDWFIEKTPLNLIIQIVLLLWIFPVKQMKQLLELSLLFALGMIAEIVGVATGFPFGEYTYGSNLGFKLMEVPVLIGCNWAVLVFCGAAIANRFFSSIWIKSFFGGALMVLLDLPMEVLAPTFDFWEFSGPVPFENYFSWFIIGALMHFVFHSLKLKGNFAFSLNLFLAQFVFFTVLAILL